MHSTNNSSTYRALMSSLFRSGLLTTIALLFSLVLFNPAAMAQVVFNGNGNTGFGGPIGQSSMSWSDDGTTISVTFTRGGGDFNDAMVIYLFTGADGRGVIDGEINDQNDGLRRAISSAGDNASNITFVPGFEASHAIAIDAGFGGLWAIPAAGPVANNELPFLRAVNSTLSSPGDASFTFEFDWADVGLEPGDPIGFVATYLNAGNSFTSNEGYGAGLPGENIGGGDFAFTSYWEFPSGDERFGPPMDTPAQVVLSAPDNNSEVLPSVTFSWEAAENALTYDLQVATDAGFTNLVVDASSIGGTSSTRFIPLNGSYFWRVRGTNPDGVGAYSDARTFSTPAVDYFGAGNGGFGSPISNSGMSWEMVGSTVNVTFYRGSGGFNNELVLYLSTGYDGRNVIDGEIDDQNDDLRRAISSTGANASTLTFPEGFEATHAIAISTGFGGLWEIPSEGPVGGDELIFRDAVNSTLSDAGDQVFTFSFNLNNLFADGRPVTELDFVAIYLNGGDGFTSNEGYGGSFPENNIGGDDFTFTGSENFDVPFSTITYNEGEGWYLRAVQSTTSARNLAAQNLVQGVPGGVYEDFTSNLFVAYTGDPDEPETTAGWVSMPDISATGSGADAFLWYMFDNEREDVPEQQPLPFTLIQVGAPFTGPQELLLHQNGDGFNIFGNPYANPLDVSDMNTYAQGGETGAIAQIWDNTQGLWEIVGSMAPGIAGIVQNTDAESIILQDTGSRGNGDNGETRAITLRLEGSSADGESSVTDLAYIRFNEQATIGRDRWETSKMAPLTYPLATAGFPGEWKGEADVLSTKSYPSNLDEEVMLPVIVDAHGTASSFSLSVDTFENIPAEWSVSLYDRVTGEIISLGDGISFEFELEPAEGGSLAGRSAGDMKLTSLSSLMDESPEHRFELIITPDQPTDVPLEGELPRAFALEQNYPNPFNPTTQIRFALPESGEVRLDVFNVQGQHVATLVKESRSAGTHNVTFDAGSLSSGVYLYRLQAGNQVFTKKMTLIK
ncbi:MAG: T9SS type A sorting domain-containing protein [Balneolia bacterium]|nr:T9SS type A sorting domain-containing protein [Balneolia bacterium]